MQRTLLRYPVSFSPFALLALFSPIFPSHLRQERGIWPERKINPISEWNGVFCFGE
jgi:hypothetical protein